MITSPEHDIDGGRDQPTTVLILPSFTFVENVRPDHAKELVERFVDPGPTTTTPLEVSVEPPLPSDAAENTIASPTTAITNGSTQADHSIEDLITPSKPSLTVTHLMASRPCPHAYIILLCSNKTRDARCGQSAPILRREFERHLRPLGLQRDLDDDRRPGGVGIYFVSHFGGHKYSANVLVYRREAQQAIWLARVRPEDCAGIIKYTVLQGKVVKPERQLRGGFDRGRGVVSW